LSEDARPAILAVDRSASRPALEVIGLTKRYGRRSVAALDGISLSVPAGSMTAFLGPNGAGKSTLLRSWLRFERPTAGSVRIGGVDPWIDERALMRVAYVPQVVAPYRELSVEDHIQLASLSRLGFDPREARDRIGNLHIPLRQRATSLSGGQRAQLFLSIALATGAPVIVLDEPLASLDPLARREFLITLTEARERRKLTVVLSSHVLGDLEEVCDRVVLLANGQILIDDTVATCLQTHWKSSELQPTTISQLPRLSGPPAYLNSGVRMESETEATLEDVILGHLLAARSAGPR
jgi:ABC-2 type transport system ATP-binding protein